VPEQGCCGFIAVIKWRIPGSHRYHADNVSHLWSMPDMVFRLLVSTSCTLTLAEA
jgi:hypothetical protein